MKFVTNFEKIGSIKGSIVLGSIPRGLLTKTKIQVLINRIKKYLKIKMYTSG